MCGITGWTDWSRDLGEQRSILERMTRTLAPRGPDAEGLWLSRHALLGHRRLAIIDLENGAQPMLAEAGGRVALTYSGEVYNFRELRAELETLGQVFRTRSDTEVVLRAYLQWGEASFARLRGIYGFALWDEREQSLWLVRDRFGVKPLYYYPTAGGVLFASEPKAIFANPEANPVLDASGIAELFALTTAPTPGHGLYKGLRQVRPGQALRFDRNGVRELVYWALRAERHEEGAEDSAERAGQLLREAVAEQLVADVPLGSLLSGGLDSSAISAFAVAALDGDARRLPTFSVDFPGEGRGFVPTPWQSSWDEPYAQLAANFLGTPHRTVLVAPEEVLEQDEAVLQARDLPGWGELDASLYLLFRQVREHTTVALSGESVDEVFGGYPFFHDPSALAHDGFPWLAGKSGPWQLLRREVAERVAAPEYIRARYREALAEVPRLDGEDAAQRRQREVAYLALSRWLPAMLERKDRMSMAVGLEVRVPFCDHRLVEYVWNLPWALKSVAGESKSLLRRALRGHLPQAILERRKSGFPANPDPRYLTLLRERVSRLLDDGTLAAVRTGGRRAGPPGPRTGHAAAQPACFGEPDRRPGLPAEPGPLADPPRGRHQPLSGTFFPEDIHEPCLVPSRQRPAGAGQRFPRRRSRTARRPPAGYLVRAVRARRTLPGAALAGATGRPGAGGQPVHHRRRPRAPARAGRQHPRRAYLDGAAALAHPPPGGQRAAEAGRGRTGQQPQQLRRPSVPQPRGLELRRRSQSCPARRSGGLAHRLAGDPPGPRDHQRPAAHQHHPVRRRP